MLEVIKLYEIQVKKPDKRRHGTGKHKLENKTKMGVRRRRWGFRLDSFESR